jgi:formamidopyrimidine-DNA glycosylase
MPELPEVESLRRSLLGPIVGQKILKVSVEKPKLVSSKGTVRQPLESKKLEFIQKLTGEKIVGIERIAKNLIFHFESKKIMLVHLKMTGQIIYKPSNTTSEIISGGHPIELSQTELPNKHSHIIFSLENGIMFYNDVRMFGYVLYYPNLETLENQEHFKDLGLDPFDPNFTIDYLANNLKQKSAKIKSVFLSQEIVLGLGNIYADEVCFYAGVRPDRSCNSLTNPEIRKLHQGIVTILTNAIDLGGSSVANYLLADGSRGNYAREHKVYKRAFLPCLVCGNILQKMIINTRTTVFCLHCQH